MAQKAIAKFIGKKNLGGVIVKGGSEHDVDSPLVQKYSSFFALPGESKEVLDEKPVAPAKVEEKKKEEPKKVEKTEKKKEEPKKQVEEKKKEEPKKVEPKKQDSKSNKNK